MNKIWGSLSLKLSIQGKSLYYEYIKVSEIHGITEQNYVHPMVNNGDCIKWKFQEVKMFNITVMDLYLDKER